MTSDRRAQFALSVGALLGAGGMLLASSQTWQRVRTVRGAPFPDLVDDIAGRERFPALFPVAIVAILGVFVVLVTAPRLRWAVGLLLAACGLAGLGYGVRGLSGLTAWPIVSGVSGLVLLGCALGIVTTAHRWSSGLSRKYDAPAKATTADDAWHALDRGDDPTIDGK